MFVCELLNDRYHLEVKFVQAGNPYNWVEQASRDNPERIPLVLHRRNGKDWLAILPLEDFLHIVK